MKQGSQEWHAHRAGCWNASDLPAARGVSKYTSRKKLLDKMKSGAQDEIHPAMQKRFDDGHRFEALAIWLAEESAGCQLFPTITVKDCGLSRPLNSSHDGLSDDGKINWEHKTLSCKLRQAIDAGEPLLEMYTSQMDQQHLTSGCARTLFTASKWDDDDNLIDIRHVWYEPKPGFEEAVISTWKKFEEDLENHTIKNDGLSLSDISNKIGIQISEDFLSSLGFSGNFYSKKDFVLICKSIIEHLDRIANK